MNHKGEETHFENTASIKVLLLKAKNKEIRNKRKNKLLFIKNESLMIEAEN